MTSWAAILVLGLTLSADPQAANRQAEAERLARTGAHAEALARFQAIAAENPSDLAARLWIARLHAWMGSPERALDVYQSIVATDPQHVEALVGAGTTLVDLGRLNEAGDALSRAEALAADQVAVLAAQAHWHAAAGRSTLAMAYYERALVIQPGNQEVRTAYDTLRAARAHRVEATYLFEHFNTDTPDTHSGLIEVNARVTDAVRLFAAGQHQRKFSRDETRGGAGFEWMPTRSFRLRAGAMGGSGLLVLPEFDTTVSAEWDGRQLTWLGTVRYLDFDGADALIVSPGVRFSPTNRAHVTLRYYRSEVDFGFADASNDGFSISATGQLSPRFWLSGGYARGFESQAVITAERLAQPEADTLSGTIRFDPAPMTSLVASLEHQWWESDVKVAVAMLSLIQRF